MVKTKITFIDLVLRNAKMFAPIGTGKRAFVRLSEKQPRVSIWVLNSESDRAVIA